MKTARLPLDPGEAFEGLWTRWPVKHAKLDAIKAWFQLGPDSTLVERMHDTLDWQLVLWAESRYEFAPRFGSWLRGHRFDDEPIRPTQSRGCGHDPNCKTMAQHTAKILAEAE